MKIKKIKEIPRVYSVHKIQGHLYVFGKEEKVLFYENGDLNSETLLPLELNIHSTFKNGGIDYLLDIETKLHILKDNTVKPFLPEYCCTDSFQIENHIMLYNGEIENMKFHVYSFIEKRILWGVANLSLYVIGGYVFSCSQNKIKGHNIETGEVLWEVNLLDYVSKVEWYKFLNLYKNVLVVSIEPSMLLGLDVLTGEKLWLIEDTNNENMLLTTNGMLKGIIGPAYYEIEVETGEHNKYSFATREEFLKLDFYNSQRDNFILLDNYILTTWGKRIGAFNIDKKEYEWIYKDDDANAFLEGKPMVYEAPHLYVIDWDFTLHIYEVLK